MVEGRGFLPKNEFLHGGEFQYFRIKPVLWERNLPKLKEMKIDVVSSYVPWIWHELEEGHFDFTGETHLVRNLVHFLSLVRENDLKFIIRPGPYIYAEYNGYGVPFWVREKYPECLIIDEKGKKRVHVSYGHPKLMELVEKWYSALYDVVKEFVEDGTIVAIQLDNETGLFLAGEVLNKVDYNPYIVSMFRLWLKEKYGDNGEEVCFKA